MNILVTGAWNTAQVHLQTLQEQGHCVVFMQNEKDALPVAPQWVEGVVCNGLFLHHDMAQFSNLRHIQLTSAGFDRVPMEQVRSRGIAIFNARGVYGIPMAEFAVGGVLQLYKQSRYFTENQKHHGWNKRRDLLELWGKQVCIVGCGNIGQECAKRFAAFGCPMVGVDVVDVKAPDFEKIYPISQLQTALAESQIVVLTLPLTQQTYHLFDSKILSAMAPGAILVNIARGGVVDTAALIQALKTHLGGAVLDVTEEEPLGADSPLWDLDNVILTPHNSFVGDGNGSRLSRVILENFADASCV